MAITPPPAAAPLELLAELTNTAPPPETPRRTALRRVKIWTPILLLLAGGFTGAQLLRPLPAPTLVAAGTGHTVDGQFSIPGPPRARAPSASRAWATSAPSASRSPSRPPASPR